MLMGDMIPYTTWRVSRLYILYKIYIKIQIIHQKIKYVINYTNETRMFNQLLEHSILEHVFNK